MTELDGLRVGIDGGGSGCRVAVASDMGVIGRGKAGPANATTDFEQAVRNVQAALDEALEGIDESSVVMGHAGLAGILTWDDAARFQARMRIPIRVTDDRPTTVVGALDGSDGIVAAIGTGSFVGMSHAGQMRFFGGWGLKVGDQASGAWLGRALLEHLLLCNDGLAAASPLTDAVMAQFAGDGHRIAQFAARAAPKDFAAFAVQVADASKLEDPVGIDLMQRGAAYLSRVIEATAYAGDLPICLTGGLGPSYGPWLSGQVQVRLVDAKGTALDGALLLAGEETTSAP